MAEDGGDDLQAARDVGEERGFFSNNEGMSFRSSGVALDSARPRGSWTAARSARSSVAS
jgi:hypothetical protein